MILFYLSFHIKNTITTLVKPWLQAPHTSKRQLLLSSKNPIQLVERRGYPQQGDGQINGESQFGGTWREND